MPDLRRPHKDMSDEDLIENLATSVDHLLAVNKLRKYPEQRREYLKLMHEGYARTRDKRIEK